MNFAPLEIRLKRGFKTQKKRDCKLSLSLNTRSARPTKVRELYGLKFVVEYPEA